MDFYQRRFGRSECPLNSKSMYKEVCAPTAGQAELRLCSVKTADRGNFLRTDCANLIDVKGNERLRATGTRDEFNFKFVRRINFDDRTDVSAP